VSRCLQADDATFSWLESYAEVGAMLVTYRVSVTELPTHHRATRTGNVSLHTATYHDAILALYHCARARWLATSGDSCHCMTSAPRNDFLSTLSHVSARRVIANVATVNHIIRAICMLCRTHQRYATRTQVAFPQQFFTFNPPMSNGGVKLPPRPLSSAYLWNPERYNGVLL